MTSRHRQDREASINMAVFRRYRFHQLFDPDGPRAFGRNVRRSLSVACSALVLAVIAFSALGYVADRRRRRRRDDGAAAAAAVDAAPLVGFVYCVIAVTVLKTAAFLRRAPVVWDLFGGARLDFLTSRRCREHDATLRRRRDAAAAVAGHFVNYTAAVFAVWCAAPLAHRALTAAADADADGRRRQNVFDLPYPVSARAFNRHYAAFYATEVAVGFYLLYNAVLVDVFVVSVCVAAAAQHEVLAAAFAGVGGRRAADGSATAAGSGAAAGYKNDSEIAYENLVSILYDQVEVYKKLKSFYSLIWIIVVSQMFANSIALIILSYSVIVIFMTEESLTMFSLIKFSTAYVVFALQIFLYCYFLNVLNDKKNSINFGMYSCDWTKMDLKFQKLLLMAMRMNNANKLMIKASPTKIINLQFFANVMSTTYNIVSVMLQRTSKNAKGVV